MVCILQLYVLVLVYFWDGSYQAASLQALNSLTSAYN